MLYMIAMSTTVGYHIKLLEALTWQLAGHMENASANGARSALSPPTSSLMVDSKSRTPKTCHLHIPKSPTLLVLES